ncbi:MAG: nitrogen fixation protein NifQ [Magnetococcales bacterium]|nr:nitrogen fixation protein NifQ [Magnetococcales bacterium]MBF0149052.1 nitrogen fixation protein NifQ [Magnetococcales bacterium]
MITSAHKGWGVMPLDLGLGPREFHAMVRHFQIDPVRHGVERTVPERLPEHEGLLQLLYDHRSVADREARWMATIVVTGCSGPDHLWSDLGLEHREQLSRLLLHVFYPLASSNTLNMKWKKFLYRQLCQREGLSLCPSPSCRECSDFPQCFGHEHPSWTLNHGAACNDAPSVPI